MNLDVYKAIAALVIFSVSMITVMYPLKKKSILQHTESLGVAEALASGIFLGAAFFHMLPDAIHLFEEIYGTNIYPLPEAICVGGFLLMLFLERLSLIKTSITPQQSIPYILALILIIHALTEGAALGVGATFSETFLIFIAILAHKASESFALCITLIRHELPFKRVVWIVIFFSLMTPLGIALGAAINEFNFAAHGKWIAAAFNAFAAGTFLYISTLHHIHFHQHETDQRGMLEFACLVLGSVMMGAIALWV